MARRGSASKAGFVSNGDMAYEFLAALEPPLSEGTLAVLQAKLIEENISLSMLSTIGMEGMDDVFGAGKVPLLERSRIVAAIGSEPLNALAPPPLGPNGEPVVVRPKIGFTNLNNIDTVGQTVFVRFFLDLYWIDPRMVGATYVPENLWRPADCYIINQVEDMSVVPHTEQPILMDKAKGLLLWPIEFCGAVVNPMDLHAFPFDRDSIGIHVHQAESSSRDEFILRPHTDDEEESQSVRFFFDLWHQVTEFEITGFSKECWEGTGGNLVEYSQCLLQLYTIRRSRYYIFKVAVPVLLCTIFCFSAFLFPCDVDANGAGASGHLFGVNVDMGALSERNNLAATMFLAVAALLYVVAAELPKVSYLTTMDIYVLVNLMIQCVIAVVSWVTTVLSNRASQIVNTVSAGLLLLVLLISTIGLIIIPSVKEKYTTRGDWPAALGREVPEIKYHAFAAFKNVFPPWQPGTKNPVKLPPKQYGEEGNGNGKEMAA